MGVIYACFSATEFIFTSLEVVGCLWTPVSVLGRSDKVVLTIMVVRWRLCSHISEPGMCSNSVSSTGEVVPYLWTPVSVLGR